MDRRNFLALTGAAAIASAGPAIAGSNVRFIELRARKVTRQLTDEMAYPTDLWLYEGSTPGPEIRAVRGETVRVRLVNELDEPTSIHWHGIRIDNAMDGVAGLTQEPVPPGESFDYVFQVPDAGTFWYHAHTSSMEQVARGLYGALIVDEPYETIPRANDFTLLLDDWWLDDEGGFQDGFETYLVGKQGGRIGNIFTVDGGPLGLTRSIRMGEVSRLRLINAANARIFTLRLKSGHGALAAVDGIALDAPQPAGEAFRLGPGQRMDFFVRADTPAPIELLDADGTLAGGDDPSKARKLFSLRPSSAVTPQQFPVLEKGGLEEPDLSSARRIKLTMEGGALHALDDAIYKGERLERAQLAEVQQVWTFNGVANLPSEPFFRAARGESVVIEIENRTGWPHAMHLHGHHFITIDGSHDSGHSPWRDTVLMDREETARIAFVANNPGKWLLHCHMLQHAAAGMNTWFEIA